MYHPIIDFDKISRAIAECQQSIQTQTLSESAKEALEQAEKELQLAQSFSLSYDFDRSSLM